MKLNKEDGLPMSVETFYVETGRNLSWELHEWLVNLETPGECWFGGHGIYFSRSDDAALFALRWL